MIHWGVSLELAQIPLHSSSYRLFRDTRRTPNRKWTARCRVFNIQIQSQRQHFEILTLIFWPKRKCFINLSPCPCPRLFKSKKIQDSFRIRISALVFTFRDSISVFSAESFWGWHGAMAAVFFEKILEDVQCHCTALVVWHTFSGIPLSVHLKLFLNLSLNIKRMENKSNYSLAQWNLYVHYWRVNCKIRFNIRFINGFLYNLSKRPTKRSLLAEFTSVYRSRVSCIAQLSLTSSSLCPSLSISFDPSQNLLSLNFERNSHHLSRENT